MNFISAFCLPFSVWTRFGHSMILIPGVSVCLGFVNIVACCFCHKGRKATARLIAKFIFFLLSYISKDSQSCVQLVCFKYIFICIYQRSIFLIISVKLMSLELR